MKKIKYLWITTLLLASVSVYADLNYTNVSLGYVNGEIESISSDGFDLRGNLSLSSDFYLLASYISMDLDSASPLITDSQDQLNIGVGWHKGISTNLDFILSASLLEIDTDFEDFDGYQLSAGIRGKPNSKFEYSIEVILEEVSDVTDIDDDIGMEFIGRYFMSDNTSIGFSLRDSGQYEQVFGINLRYDF